MTTEDGKFSYSGDVAKTDAGRRIVGGWFSVFKVNGEEVVDLDNEVVDMADYRDAYIDFAKTQRAANFEHEGPIVADLVDSILIDSEEFAKMIVAEITGLDPEDIPVKKLGHFGSFQFREKTDFDAAMKNGQLGFSIEGRCTRELDE